MITLDEARSIRDEHDPQQRGQSRCDRCSFTRHPCDVFQLADDLVTLLEGQRARDERIIRATDDHMSNVFNACTPDAEVIDRIIAAAEVGG